MMNKTGFTIVETLVAIAILMISIAGPLTIAQKGLMASLYARDQITASFLAQDAMEFIKKKKIDAVDFNAWVKTFNDNIDNSVANCKNKNNKCPVDTYKVKTMYNTPCMTSCTLYNHSDSTYGMGQENGSVLSKFERGFYMTDLGGGGVTLTVVVDWYNGTIPNSVILQTNLFDVAL